jgi:hypothetical protein
MRARDNGDKHLTSANHSTIQDGGRKTPEMLRTNVAVVP